MALYKKDIKPGIFTCTQISEPTQSETQSPQESRCDLHTSCQRLVAREEKILRVSANL